MQLRYGLRFLLTAVALLLLAMPALAGRTSPVSHRLPGAAGIPDAALAPATKSMCALGVAGPAAMTVGYIYPDEDQYYTLIDPTECVDGGTCGVTVATAHIVLDFGYAMTTPVRVGIVAADLTDAECPVPVPGSYVCDPVEYDLAGPDAGIHDIALPLGASCPLTGPAFLEITFTTWGPYWDVPGLVLTGACDPCRSYNYFPGQNYDLCTFGFEGNPIMYVDAECGNPVAQERSTWGELKAQYR